MKTLYLIPARGGSKRLPNKNILDLCGKPLIQYTIDCARDLADDCDICISTDSERIKSVVEECGLHVPFLRPDYLSSNHATTNDVILHALEYYEKKGTYYDVIVLLQPTSPLRKVIHIKEALELYTSDIDMVVSVKESHLAAIICHENQNGFLEMSINKQALRSQEVQGFYEYNGAVYVINSKQLRLKGLVGLTRKIKFVMDSYSSIDIDTRFDFDIVTKILKND